MKTERIHSVRIIFSHNNQKLSKKTNQMKVKIHKNNLSRLNNQRWILKRIVSLWELDLRDEYSCFYNVTSIVIS